MKKSIYLGLLTALLLVAGSAARAHEKVKLTGYVTDVVCFGDHAKGTPEAMTKVAAEHTKECALMAECVKGGYGIVADGKWLAFDEKGNQLAKGVFDQTKKKDHIKMIVEGLKHGDKVLVEKITETE